MSDEEYEPLEHVANILEKVASDYRALHAENARLRDQLDYFGNLAREHKDELETQIARLRDALKPFGDICKQIENAFDVDEKVSVCFGETDLSNLRAARAAVGEK